MTQNQRPERQHYITDAYLKLFSFQIKKKLKIWVYDLKEKSWRISQSSSEAVERNFQTLDHFIGLDPYYLEKEFSRIENRAIEVIKKIIHEHHIPSSLENFSPVINLMGLFAGRNLFVRKELELTRKFRSLKVLIEAHKDESTFRDTIGRVLEEYSIGWPSFSSYDESKRFLENGQFEIQADRSQIVEKMSKIASEFVDLFGSLNWMLLETIDRKFITSNKPVNPVRMMGFEPRYALLYTFFIFPLSPYFALLGSWSPLPLWRKVDSSVVEGINWVTANTGATELFSSEKCDLASPMGLFHLQIFHRLLWTRLIDYKKN